MFRDDHEEHRLAWEIKLPFLIAGAMFVSAVTLLLIGAACMLL